MRFEVKALRGNEGLTALALDAADSGDATAKAAAQGYTVIAVRARHSWQIWKTTRKTNFPLVLFSQELLALLDAGLALVEALETLAEKEQRPEVKKTLSQIVACLYEGHPLSYALRQSETNFPPLYVAAVRASEKTGALAGYEPKPGTITYITVPLPDGSVGRFPIVASNETTVTVDMNHPLAGQDLVFNIQLVDIVKK